MLPPFHTAENNFSNRIHFKTAPLKTLNHQTPEIDWHLISPYNIILESHFDIARLKEMITNSRSS